jgi:uncharacterized membrane protein
MRRFRPIHGILLVLAFTAAVVVAQMAYEGQFKGTGYELVKPGSDGQVNVDLSGIGPKQVRFFRFLNRGNQEVRFFVGKDAEGVVQVAFDASETCAKTKRGFHQQGEWVICNKCDKSFKLAEINAGGGGCKPVPLAHQVDGNQLRIAENDVLQGWRLFR